MRRRTRIKLVRPHSPLSLPYARLVLIAILAGPYVLAAQELPFTHFSPDRENLALPAAGVTDVYQDRGGFLWMTILSVGVVRYDGQSMETFGMDDGLIDLSTNGLLEDNSGRLWVNSVSGVVVSKEPVQAYQNGRRPEFTSTWAGFNITGSPANNKSVAVGPDGSIWIGTATTGVVRYRIVDDDEIEIDTFRTDLITPGEHLPIYSVAVLRDGKAWAGGVGGQLFVMETGSDRFRLVPLDDSFGTTTTVLFEDSTGTLWGGGHDGTIWRLDPEKSSASVVDDALGQWIEDIAQTADGSLWFSSLGSGLRRLHPRGEKPDVTFTRRHGLLSNVVHGGWSDREGNFWFGSDQGLSRLRANYEAFEHYTSDSREGELPVLPAATVTSIVVDTPTAGSAMRTLAWIGTVGGLAHVDRAGRRTWIRREEGLPGSVVYALETDQDGRIWIGQNGPTAVLLPEGIGLPPFGSAAELSAVRQLPGGWRLGSFDLDNVYVIRRMPLRVSAEKGFVESLWFLSYRKVACLVADEWFVFREDAGFPATAASAAAVDSLDYLWIGTEDRGLLRSRHPITKEVLDSLATRRDAPGAVREVTNSVLDVVWDASSGGADNIQALFWHDGVMWAGTPRGLFGLQPLPEAQIGSLAGPLRVAAHLTTASGLGHDSVMSLDFAPNDGTFWAGTNGGLAQVEPSEHRVLRIVTRGDGLIADEVSFHGSVRVANDGSVYFGTPRGLTRYRPDLDRQNPLPPPIVLRDVRLTENRWGSNEITINYAALSLADERAVRYKTRLVGYRSEWSPETNQVTAHFTNLPALLLSKTYVFEVQASNNHGVWTEVPLQYAFSVRPAWWKDWWAFLLYGILIIGSVAGIARIQRGRTAREERGKAFLREQALRTEAAEAWANYLQAENERQMQELERARRLQLSMLPESVPQHPDVEIAAMMRTATEVGGDYYDFHVSDDGTLTFAIGDATGHGLAAGTVVTAMKGLWNAFSGEPDLTGVMYRTSTAFKRMRIPMLYMAVALGRLRGNRLELIGAGMPAALIYREATKRIESVPLKGLPLGSPGNPSYRSTTVQLSPGDTVVLMSDGLPELRNVDGEMLGYDALGRVFSSAVGGSAETVLKRLQALVSGLCEDRAPNDDVTLLVLRARQGDNVRVSET